jgi:thiol-disulfide isomerase/thioredoxin
MDQGAKTQTPAMLSLVGGGALDFSDYKGQWVLINYWAIWCKPCIEEMPELNALNDESDVAVFTYNFDQESGDTLAQQAQKLEINMPMLEVAPASFFEQEQPAALPATIVIDPQGAFHSWLMGPQTATGIKRYLNLE